MQTITRYDAQDPKQEVVVCDDTIRHDLEVAQQLTGLNLAGVHVAANVCLPSSRPQLGLRAHSSMHLLSTLAGLG